MTQGLSESLQIGFIERIHDYMAYAFRLTALQRVSDRFHTFLNRAEVDTSDGAGGLRREQANQVCVGHRIERMFLHAGFVQQYAIHKQMTVDHRSPVLRQGRAVNDVRHVHRFHQRIADRTDVAGRGRIKGGAIFKVNLLGTCGVV